MMFKGDLTEMIFAPLVHAEMAEETLKLVEFLRYGPNAVEKAHNMVDDRRIIEELTEKATLYPRGNFRVNKIDAAFPETPDWGPKNSEDPVAKRVFETLPNPTFLMCFYTTAEHRNRIEVLVQGKTNTDHLELIHRALDDMIGVNLQKLDRLNAGSYTQ
jgi:hypothetical protein